MSRLIDCFHAIDCFHPVPYTLRQTPLKESILNELQKLKHFNHGVVHSLKATALDSMSIPMVLGFNDSC